VATNVYYDFDAAGFARSTLFSHPRYGSIIAKIDETGLWRCTYQEDASLSLEQIEERMRAHFARILPDQGNSLTVDAYRPYTMHQRAAERLRTGRVLLAGDAGHATNPTGGLGLTSGLFDSYALVPTLTGVIQDSWPEDVLDVWSEDRRSRFLNLASPQATEMKRLVYDEADPARRRQDLEALRRSSADEDALRERLLFTKKLESDPVTPDRLATA
jgi:3-(3-hydroxy-phenyl)propionate hydroxylase/6-hydroxy-3-succinoylpyridine 3-monooxygenase